MRRIVVGFGCVWILWSAQADGPGGTAALAWTAVAKLGGREECVAQAARLKGAATGTPPQYVCLPEGERPPRS
jgi:hypothetical protein